MLSFLYAIDWKWILDEYAIYFNDAVDKFNALTQATLSKQLMTSNHEDSKSDLLNSFEKFRPFVPENFDQIKNDFQKIWVC